MELAASIAQELVKVGPFPECSFIYIVHDRFRRRDEYAYTPQFVSIGPFHCDKESLKPMEATKLRYMDELLNGTGNKEGKLNECINSMRSSPEESRNFYSPPMDLGDKFTRRMMVDGLFIIELFLKSAGEVEVDISDPVFSNKWVISSLVRDMILFENQLPMSVLDKLFTITKPNQCSKTLKELAVLFFDPLMRRDKEVLGSCFNREGKHLLDFLSKTFTEPLREKASNNNQEGMTVSISTENKNQQGTTSSINQEVASSSINQEVKYSSETKYAPCATELRKVGVKFKKRIGAATFLDIKFNDGELEIPPLFIQDLTNILLRNLIVSEQYSDEEVCYMGSYVVLMDSLIDSASDVEILRKAGVITHWLGDDKYVSLEFTKLRHEVTVPHLYYAKLCNELNTFRRKPSNLWLQDLREYFQTPWKAISIVVAGLVLLFTAGAFVFAVLSFSLHKN